MGLQKVNKIFSWATSVLDALGGGIRTRASQKLPKTASPHHIYYIKLDY